MNFNFSFAVEIAPRVLEGIGSTVMIALISFAGASALGLFWELLRRSHPVARPVIQFVIDAIRSTPALVQIYFLFFVLPFYGVTLPALLVGSLGLSFYYSGYMAEVFKAGIDAVPAGQSEAAQSLGLSWGDVIRFVVLPQMLRNVAAPLGAYSISILKSTPLLAVISVPELLGSALDVASDSYRYAEPMFDVGVVFLAMSLIAVACISQLERRLGLTDPSH